MGDGYGTSIRVQTRAYTDESFGASFDLFGSSSLILVSCSMAPSDPSRSEWRSLPLLALASFLVHLLFHTLLLFRLAIPMVRFASVPMRKRHEFVHLPCVCTIRFTTTGTGVSVSFRPSPSTLLFSKVFLPRGSSCSFLLCRVCFVSRERGSLAKKKARISWVLCCVRTNETRRQLIHESNRCKGWHDLRSPPCPFRRGGSKAGRGRKSGFAAPLRDMGL